MLRILTVSRIKYKNKRDIIIIFIIIIGISIAPCSNDVSYVGRYFFDPYYL